MADSNSPSFNAAYEEIGAYRSLSSLAVLSVVFGILSFLAFAPTPLFLYLFPPAAVILGFIALRRISSAPEVWTGLRLAKVGIALGVICAGGSLGAKFMDSYRIGRHGRIVADRFVNKLKAGDPEGAFWLKYPREARIGFIGKTMDDVPGELPQQYSSFFTDTAQISEQLARGEATLEFESLENTLSDHDAEYAAVVYRYHSPKEDTRILVVAASNHAVDSRGRSWYIREHRPGYTPNSFLESQNAGHGHVH